MDYFIRFCIGGVAVSVFALLSDIFRPKSFAGLFGAAPSIALSTLAIAFWQHGPGYMSIEGRSMVLGALALWAYCVVACWMMERRNTRAFVATGAALVVWCIVAFGGKFALLGH